MTGTKGKSGGQRDGAGRPRSKITVRIGDQFHVPGYGLATVTEISIHRFVVEIDGERMVFGAQSHKKTSA